MELSNPFLRIRDMVALAMPDCGPYLVIRRRQLRSSSDHFLSRRRGRSTGHSFAYLPTDDTLYPTCALTPTLPQSPYPTPFTFTPQFPYRLQSLSERAFSPEKDSSLEQ